MSSRKLMFLLVALLTISATALSACAPAAAPTAAPAAGGSAMDQLIAAAKAEGTLTTIALPHEWCNYGGAIDGFKAKYGIAVNELNPNGSSGEELQAIVANKDNKGPQAPDVVDVGLGFGPQAVKDGLLQPYKVAEWNDIPNDVKDPDGYWWADYYGVMAFEVNADIVKNAPQDWPDLLKPEYAHQVALSGDPRIAAQAVQGVFAAGLSADGGDIAGAGDAGLKFFADLNKAGNFVPIIAKTGQVAKGEAPISITWDYLSLADNDTLAGNPPITTVVPKTGVVAGVYIQGISAYAPHPNAAKLWEEYLYSDEGQIQWLKGYCHPIRFNVMAKAGTLPADLVAKLPPAENYAKAVFPTLDQQDAYKKTITTNWDSVVGADVK
jgi:putative spermidine/putrescine transport system substrate-binding protein